MMRTMLVAMLLAGALPQRGAPPPPPAPAPGSPAVFKAGDELLAALKNAAEGTTGMTATAVSITDQYRIQMVRRARAAGALTHAGNSELLYIVEGAGTIVTGGSIVRPPQPGSPASILNGSSRRFVKGDVILVPPDTPHWFKDVDETVTYLEARFVAPK